MRKPEKSLENERDDACIQLLFGSQSLTGAVYQNVDLAESLGDDIDKPLGKLLVKQISSKAERIIP
jgi:hypothetical protein